MLAERLQPYSIWYKGLVLLYTLYDRLRMAMLFEFIVREVDKLKEKEVSLKECGSLLSLWAFICEGKLKEFRPCGRYHWFYS
jgi:hypothetical protein